MQAACLGHVDALRSLIEYGANVNKESVNGVTALLTAAQHGRVEVAQILVDHGANMEHMSCIPPLQSVFFHSLTLFLK
jgi:ankyrin repeat protein